MNCKNCKSQLLEKSNYCNHCGAKIITTRLQFKKTISEWASNIFNINNNFIATYLHLFSNPQDVIIGYIQGLRKRYMSPINFILLSFGIYGFYILAFNGTDYQSNMVSGFYEGWGTVIGEEEIQKVKIFNLLIYLFQFLLFALSFKIIFRKDLNYAENLIIASYWFGHLILNTVILNIIFRIFRINNIDIIQAIFFLFFMIYTLWIQKNIFKNSWLNHFFQLIGFIVLSYIFYGFLVSSIAFILYLTS